MIKISRFSSLVTPAKIKMLLIARRTRRYVQIDDSKWDMCDGFFESCMMVLAILLLRNIDGVVEVRSAASHPKGTFCGA